MSDIKTNNVRIVLEKSNNSGQMRLRNVNVSTLIQMRHAGRLTQDQVAAAFRLKQDFNSSTLMSLKASDAARVVVDGGFSNASLPADFVLDAEERVRKALKMLPENLASVVTDVCLFDWRLSHIDKYRRWRKGRASRYLKDGLDALDEYYQSLDQEQAEEERMVGLEPSNVR